MGNLARTLNHFLILMLAALVTTPVALAQTPSAALLGSVEGTRGESPAGVRVRLSREGSPLPAFESTTDSAGNFSFLGLSPGSYMLEFTHIGRQPERQGHVEIRSGSTLEIRIALSPLATFPALANSPIHLADRDVWWGSQFDQIAISMLPNSRNIWSLLESQEPSSVTNRLDVGGLETGVPALFGALGASWTENRYTLNGFDVTNPYIPGRPDYDPDFDALAEFQVVTGAKSSAFSTSGIGVSLATTQPSEHFHGSSRVFYSGRRTSSDNLDARLRRIQFPGPERVNHLVDGSVQAGGKVPFSLAPWPIFVSLSTQQLSKNLGGFAAPIDVRIYRGLLNFSPFMRDSQRLDLLCAGQHIFNSREGADLRVQPSATTRGNDNFHQFQSRWHKTLSSSALLSLGFGADHAIVASGIQAGLQGMSVLNLPQMEQSGPSPLALAGSRTRYESSGLAETVRNSPAGSHSLGFGANWNRSYISNRWDAQGGMEQILADGAGSEVTRWNTPTRASQHVQNLAVFAQDAWRPVTWLRLPVGLRFEASSGRAADAERGIRWTAVQPRAGVVLPLDHRGLVLRANWSRYAHLLQGRYLDFGNPAALGGQVFRWQDSNGDGFAQMQEITTLLSVFGGPYSALDHGLAQPFTDETSVGLEQSFGLRFHADVRFFRRDDHRLIGLTNVGVPFSSYIPVPVLDPGNDGISGTVDDQTLTLYNRDLSSLGRDLLLLTNPPGNRASYKGFEIRLSKPLLQLWEFSASFAATKTLAPTSPGNSVFENDTGFIGSLGTDPNTLLLADSRTYFDRAFVGKATGFYLAPRGLQLGAVAKYYDGLPFGRMLFVNGFNQGPFFVRATPCGHPGGFQTQFNFTLDVRIARKFALRRGNLSGYLDFFNILNMSRNTLEADLTGPTFQSRVPLAIESPRIARLGLEWSW